MPPEYRISLDPSELQFDAIHGFLSRAYWSPGVSRELVEKAARHSLVVGAYHLSGAQVGFARLVTDHATFGYLSDVFVLEGHRKQGLARAMTRTLLEQPEVKTFRRVLLATRDAHGVYEACGFKPLREPRLFMQIARQDPCESPVRLPIVRLEDSLLLQERPEAYGPTWIEQLFSALLGKQP